MRPIAEAFVAVLVAVLAVACGGAEPADPTVVRADSAGVRLITSGPADRALAWTFTEIGPLSDADGNPWVFDAVSPVRVLTDRGGRTYVIGGDTAVLRFGRDGRLDRVLGAAARGPGGFLRPVRIAAQADTLVVTDLGKGALVRFGPTLDPVEDRPLDGALATAEWHAYRAGGLWLVQGSGGEERVHRSVLRADTLSGAPLLEAEDATIVAHAEGPRVVAHRPSTYEVRLFEGPRLLAMVRRPVDPAAVAITRLALQKDGTLWVERTVPGVVEARRLDVFGPDGVYVGTLEGRGVPVGLLPNGEVLFVRARADGPGVVIVRTNIRR
ncbi:MAG: hypothetical protein P2975_06850 [Gemmatimonadota bacterium]|nr:hypothetical protein [Gemmatimonadota bacterium]MDQ8169826.1 hypothetical protein [Gemmatimonadota bacterium]MDQ8178974.1 hypothetical protein [Gemmatimonadota bacterium]